MYYKYSVRNSTMNWEQFKETDEDQNHPNIVVMVTAKGSHSLEQQTIVEQTLPFFFVKCEIHLSNCPKIIEFGCALKKT